MNNFVEWLFAEFWGYTKLTFRLIFWLVRLIAAVVSRILNMRQARPQTPQADLFEPPSKGRK